MFFFLLLKGGGRRGVQILRLACCYLRKKNYGVALATFDIFFCFSEGTACFYHNSLLLRDFEVTAVLERGLMLQRGCLV